MKKRLPLTVLILCIALLPSGRVHAQFAITEIIREGITKVIVAVDLQIQRLQNETIWLQNAQQTLENRLSRLKLQEIASWMDRQRTLYEQYYEELWKVKAALAYYERVKGIIEGQKQMLSEYRAAWTLLRQDKNFTPGELDHMLQVYTGMLEEGGRIIGQLELVVRAFTTQMSDAERLRIIDEAARAMEQTLSDLRAFNSQNRLLALRRAAALGEIDYARKLYGLR